MPYTLPDLPYGFDALEPVIDTETMKIHHGKHHQAYVDKLNAALDHDVGDDNGLDSLKKLLLSNNSSPVQNNGGGHFNHSFFWKTLHPQGKGEPSEQLKGAINDAFGSYEAFVKAFSDAALTRFGSGWAWLAVEKSSGSLKVFSMPNQDHPNLATHEPLLGLDVWEHAYYLKYQNRRPEYINAFFSIINWHHVNHLYEKAMGLASNGSS